MQSSELTASTHTWNLRSRMANKSHKLIFVYYYIIGVGLFLFVLMIFDAILHRRHARVFLEVLAKERGIGEV